MGKKRWTRILLASFIACSLIATSMGGAFATAALAATPDEANQQVKDSNSTNTAAVGGIVALGLIAMLARGHDKGGSASPQKASTPASTPAATSTPTSTPASAVTQKTQTKTQPTSQPASSGLTADEQKALSLLNADRAANGLPALRANLKLTSLAENYAQDMISRGFFSHYNPEGLSPFDRMRNAGIPYGYAGENLAINTNVTTAENAFMNSPGHRANILNSKYTQVGLGVRYSPNGAAYVVQEYTDG